MKKIKKIVACIMAAIIPISLVGCSGEDSAETETIRLCEVTHSVFYAPQYVAMEMGFFEEEGLEVSLTNAGGTDKVMAAILSDNMDIGLAGPEACIYVYNSQKEDYPVVFGQLTKRDGSFLISREPVFSFLWDDLKGKTVIPGRKGGVPYMTFSYVLKQNGLTPGTDVVLDDSIQFDLMAGAFSNGTADYVTLFEPTASAIVDSGKGYYATSIGAESGEIPYTGYCAKQSYLEENSLTVQKFINAVAKGQEWTLTHSAQEVAQVISGQFPDTDIESLTKAVENYKAIDAWNQTPVMTEEAFNRLQDVMIDAGELEQKIPFDKVVNNYYAEEAIK